MTNTQFYLVVGLPIIVNLINTGIIILYVNFRFGNTEKVFTEKFLRIEDRLGIGK